MKKFKLWSWIVCGFLLLFLGATFVFHQFSLRNESKLLTPIGKQVTVNGHRMNVSVKGEGPETIVFLSGAGIASPILDFKDLSDSLSKKYKVVVVERAGYGFSEDSDRSRDVMEVLSETRQALAQAHVSGPYVIISHSMASLESLAWQEKYPNEVKALIGLDWALPASYEDLKEHPTLITLAYWTSKIGLLRYFPESVYLKNSDLTKSERQQYRFLAYKQLLSTAMLMRPVCKGKCQKVRNLALIRKFQPYSWFLMGREPALANQSGKLCKRFSSDQSNVQVDYMDAPHDLYHYQSDAIVSRIKEFLENN